MSLVNAQSNIDSGNSSDTPLDDGAVFTGRPRDVSGYATTTVFVDTDVDGIMSMQFSVDAVNWDRATSVEVDQEISSGSVHTLEVIARFFRVVYTNGTSGGDQTHFRLQTIHSETRSGFLTSSPDEMISKINDAQIVRVSNDPIFDIARGLYADKHAVHVFGHNKIVPNGSMADIWAYGPTDPTYNWPTTNEKFRVKAGGNVNDTSAGTGARTIQIIFLNATGVQVQEQLTLAGVSASASTVVTGRRILKAWVDTCGTILSSNTGDIVIENETANQVVGFIEATEGTMAQSMYTVPFEHTAYITSISVSVATGTNKDAHLHLWQRQNAYVTSAPFSPKRIMHEWTDVQGVLSPQPHPSPHIMPALTDIWFDGEGNGATTGIDVFYSMVLVHGDIATIPQ